MVSSFQLTRSTRLSLADRKHESSKTRPLSANPFQFNSQVESTDTIAETSAVDNW